MQVRYTMGERHERDIDKHILYASEIQYERETQKQKKPETGAFIPRLQIERERERETEKKK